MDKHLKGQIIVEKLTEDFDLLSEFRLIQKNMHTPSYAQSVVLKLITKEMMAYNYPLQNQWSIISMFGM